MRPIILVALLLLTACKEQDCYYVTDLTAQHKYFNECLSLAAKQPNHNHEDDNGHLIQACHSAAFDDASVWTCKWVDVF